MIACLHENDANIPFITSVGYTVFEIFSPEEVFFPTPTTLYHPQHHCQSSTLAEEATLEAKPRVIVREGKTVVRFLVGGGERLTLTTSERDSSLIKADQ